MKRVSIAAAALGVAIAFWAAIASSISPPVVEPDDSPPLNPFKNGIAATGSVESLSRNVRIAAPEPGLITKVFVQVNDTIKVGDALFQLDTRLIETELAQAEAAVHVSHRELERLRALPRPEEIARLTASLEQANARYTHARREKDRSERIRARGALSEQEFGESSLALDEATSAQAQAQAEVNRAKAGAWKHDLLVAEASLRRVESEVHSIRARIDRLTIHSPIAGTVLKRHIEAGEMAPTGAQPAIIVGDLSALNVRAHVDERDAHRLNARVRAICFNPGQSKSPQNLSVVRIEPLAVRKDELTASTSEVVDVRVVEVLFRVEAPNGSALAFYPGQVVDVFIDAENSP
jgi:HlyD family secretion protein